MRRLLIVPFVGMLACSGEDVGKKTLDAETTETLFNEVTFDIDVRQEIALPPDFGQTCDENSDCSQDFCVEGPSGFVCTKTCIEECPEGWGCKGVQSGSSDVTFVCVPDGAPQPDVIINDSEVGNEIGIETSNEVETTDTGPDTDTVGPTTGNACEAPPGSTNEVFLQESMMVAGDLPDCLAYCGFEMNPSVWGIDLRTTQYTAVHGYFDGSDHTYEFETGDGPGPDVDVIALQAAPRTMVELAVLKDDVSSSSDPVIYVGDGFSILTYNSDVASNNSCARSQLAYPFVTNGTALYVYVEDAANYDRLGPNGYSAGIVGGLQYGYTLRIRSSAFSPTELGTLARGQTRNLSGERLTVGGEVRYYRFYAPGTAAPRVTITRTAGAAFIPTASGMKTISDQLEWRGYTADSGSGVLQLGPTSFRPCIPASECPSGVTCAEPTCTDAQVEYVFVVTDYNGAAGPGTFSYDIAVRVD